MDTVKRAEKRSKMRRKVDLPLEYLPVTVGPWSSDWIYDQVKAGIDCRAKMRRVFGRWFPMIAGIIGNKRQWLGASLHTDTSDAHVDLLFSRFDGLGGKIGPQGLGLGGPWLTAVDRQLRAGAIIAPNKRRQFERDMQRHRSRYGDDAVPLDVQLARSFDAAAETEIPELAEYKRRYAAMVPELEKTHLEYAIEKSRQRLKTLNALVPATPEADFTHETDKNSDGLVL